MIPSKMIEELDLDAREQEFVFIPVSFDRPGKVEIVNICSPDPHRLQALIDAIRAGGEALGIIAINVHDNGARVGTKFRAFPGIDPARVGRVMNEGLIPTLMALGGTLEKK